MKKGFVKFLLGFLIGGGIAWGFNYYFQKKNNKAINARTNKFVDYFNVMHAWMLLRENGKNLSTYFEENDIKKIAIYGMGKLGGHLLKELENTKTEVRYGIDRKGSSSADIRVYGLEERWPEVDAIVVTATFDYDNISKDIEQRSDAMILSLDSVVYEME